MMTDRNVFEKADFLVGNMEFVERIPDMPARKPFDEETCLFLNHVSRRIMGDKRSRKYSDVISFAFWIREASLNQMKNRFDDSDRVFRLGRGTVFHIAPSNVPVNFAYSLTAALLTGNNSIVRIPTRPFEQVDLISDAVKAAIQEVDGMKGRICLVRYGHHKEVNDLFSSIADVRIIWGGDATIAQVRQSPLPPRSTEVTFADRYSLAVIDAEAYLRLENKEQVAQDFYNDTYFTDQNACTSPRIVVWTGNHIEEARGHFWGDLNRLVSKKYVFQDIQGVHKLTNAYLLASEQDGVLIEPREDNLVFRVKINSPDTQFMDKMGNSGYFFEYECYDLTDLKDLCDDKRCQTISYVGNPDMFDTLLDAGIKGVDRIVPVGKTMDFDLFWDGYDLYSCLTRVVAVSYNL